LRRHLASLPFATRCTASGYGWICAAGGRQGTFAVISVNPTLSLNDDPLINRGNECTERHPSTKLEYFGHDIINSISIHKIDGNAALGIRDDVVALLTSNDKTVRIFSLPQHMESSCLDLEFAVNHATISPDGKLLVAVGDYQRAYFFEKIPLDPAQSKMSTAKYASNHVQWLELRLVDLHVPKPTQVIGYFTTAWSPSSTHCAVASESGYITVISIDAILRDDRDNVPIPAEEVSLFISPSSRPDVDNGPGAVRAMLFAPAPSDLLVWIEGQGRVCVADLRYGLRKRQVINLDINEKGLVHVATDPESDHSLDPYSGHMMFEEADNPIEQQTANEYNPIQFGGSEEYLIPSRRVLRALQQGTSPLNGSGAASSASAERPREGATADYGTSYSTISTVYWNPDTQRFSDVRPSRTRTPDAAATSTDSNEDTIMLGGSSLRLLQYPSDAADTHSDRYSYSGELTAEERELMNALTSASHIVPAAHRSRELRRARNTVHVELTRSDRTQTDETSSSTATRNGGSDSQSRRAASGTGRSHPFAARRQASIVISNDDGTNNAQAPTPPYSRRYHWGELASGRSRSRITEEFEAWRRSPPPERYQHLDINAIRLRRQIDRARERSDRLRRSGQLSQTTQHLILRRMQDSGNSTNGINTQGLCISPDGQRMWVGTTQGIFEFSFNMPARFLFPGIDMR
jgi:uncharacterized protein DUF2415